MNKIIIFMFVSGLFISGCATTETTSATMQTQMRLVALEKQIRDKDQEIQTLQYGLNDLTGEVQRLRAEIKRQGTLVQPVKKQGPAPATDEEIIRVPVNAEDVQTALKNAGCYAGPIDGKVGRQTKASIEKFQKEQGLTVDGVIGQKTWVSLKEHLKDTSD